MSWAALHRHTVTSTNAEAVKLAEAGEQRKFWLRADMQTEGRGRDGRSWHFMSGNLAVSYVFETDAEPRTLSQLSLVAGVAVAEAVKPLLKPSVPPLQLKWPNDVLHGTAKAGGILAESTAIDGRQIIIIGVGLNVSSAPQLNQQATAAIGTHMVDAISLDDLAAAIAGQLDLTLTLWQGGNNFSAIRTAWLGHGLAPGTEISIRSADGRRSGQFCGLDTDGAMLFGTPNGDIRRITVGDVSLAD